MNLPEVTRWLMLAGLAVVTYLLVLAWQRDHVAAATALAAAQETNARDTAPASTETPSPSNGGSVTTHSDVPQIPTTPIAARAGVASASQPIVVETDTLRVSIDPSGGDIVRTELLAYPQSSDESSKPMVLLARESAGHVYIAQSGLVGTNGPDAAVAGRPTYTAERQHYALQSSDSQLSVVLSYVDRAGVRYEKRYAFKRGQYTIGLEQVVRNQSASIWRGNPYSQLKRDGSEPPSTSSGFGPKPYFGAATTGALKNYTKVSFSDLEETPLEAEETGGWIAMMQHYFISAWIATPGTKNKYFGRKGSDGNYLVGYIGPELLVQPGASGSSKATLYVGPKVQADLERAAPHLGLTIDYGYLWFLASLLFKLMQWLQGVVHNWGVSIILLTLVVKAVLYPLSAASYRSMAKMREVAPEMRRLQERHADDRQKLGQEMMAMYKKEKVNPLGGCLPMLVQMPVFLSLYWVLYESVELRLAPFFGWIKDLAVMDPWFVLPLLMGITMFLQQSLNPPMPDPMQARMMKMMPIIFTVMFMFFPAGLVLYWLTNNVLSMAQQWWVTRQVEQQSKAKA